MSSSAPKRRHPVADFLVRLFKEQRLGAVGGLVVLALVFVTIFAEQLAPYEFDRGRVQERMQGSSAEHLLGTDHVGRDFLSRLIMGARLSLTVGLAATSINVVVALLIGGTTGFIGGKLDIVTQRLVDAWMSFPGLLLLLTIMSIAGRGVPQIIVVLGVAGGIPAPRTTRDPAMPPLTPSTMITCGTPRPTIDMMVSNSSRPGKAIQASTNRCIIKSSLPPR